MPSSGPAARGLQAPPRIMIGAPHGRSGKTVVSIGICRALARRGIKVQAFKKGPDYIDPSWLSAASGRDCRTLDAFLMPEDRLLENFTSPWPDTDLALIEGNMGLFDGMDREGGGSSAALARLTRTPVILVVDSARMSRSAAALVKGFMEFEPGTAIAGVILNNVAGERHRKKLTEAVEGYCGIPVFGAVPRSKDLTILERHLGLVPFAERTDTMPLIERIADAMDRYLSLEALVKAAGEAPLWRRDVRQEVPPATLSVRMGVLADQVFSFYYPENLEALAMAGAELVLVDSVRDKSLPEIDGLYIGGGFPEFHLPALSENRGLMADIASRIEEGLPVYAECAGLMYLSRSIIDKEENRPMMGIFPFDVEMTASPQGHGYVEGVVEGENPFYPPGTRIRGHEFHHSRIRPGRQPAGVLRMVRGRGMDGKTDGLAYKNVWASYTHIHALGTPEWATTFTALASRRAGSRVNPATADNQRR